MLAEAIRAEISPEYLRDLVSQVKEMQKHTRAWCPNCEQHVTVFVPDLPRVISALTGRIRGYARPALSIGGMRWSSYDSQPTPSWSASNRCGSGSGTV